MSPSESPPSGVATADPVDGDAASCRGVNRWKPLSRRDVGSLAACLVVLLTLTLPRLPPGICFGDTGELQLVARTLGITHAPGYPAFASIGYLVTQFPFLDPAYAVTLACYFSGIAVFSLCALTQMRLGVPTPVAVTVALCFLWPSRTWINLVAAEVYTPTLALQATSAYLLMRYDAKGRKRDLSISAFSFGLAMASRPPVFFALPFVFLGWWHARKRWAAGSKAILRSLALVTICGAIPSLYSFAYLYVRDNPNTPYDYIHLHDTEFNLLPDVSEGVRAKVYRVLWHVSGREFSYAYNTEWKHVRQKLRWLRNEFLHGQSLSLAAMCCVVVVGGVLTWRRARCIFWPLLGMVIGSLLFICSYRMYGQAADYFPLLWTAFVWFGVGVSLFFLADPDRRSASDFHPVNNPAPITQSFVRRATYLGQKHGGTLAFAVVAALTIVDTPRRPAPALSGGATDFVDQMDFATLPRDAVICVAWPETPVVFYAKHVLAPRDDIAIVSASIENWPTMLAPYLDRPIFAASAVRRVPGFELTSYRNLLRLQPTDGRGESKRENATDRSTLE